MYFRQIVKPPDSLIKNGRAVFGTFEGHPSKLDIRGLRAPFGGVPLPAFISNFRIKSSIQFCFSAGEYLGLVSFLDNKIFGLAGLILWNTQTRRKYTYRYFMGPRRRFIPHSLEQGFCASFNPHHYIRISWDHRRDRVSVIFNIRGNSVSPSVQAALTGHFSDSSNSELTQCVPIKSRRRCMAVYTATPTLRGSLTIGKTKKSEGQAFSTEEASSIFFIKRAYYGYTTQGQDIFASGIHDGKKVSFCISNCADTETDQEAANHNALFVDGKCTPLPAVRMTQPFGLDGKWVIQDTENMVDLTFEPASTVYRNIKAFAFKITAYNIYGTFEGVLKTSDGQDIKLSGFGGIARDVLLRI